MNCQEDRLDSWDHFLKEKDWKRLLAMAYEKAKESRDPSTQNGALVVTPLGRIVAFGINQFPRGVKETPDRWQRPLKYRVIEHAERNAIYEMARRGFNGEHSSSTILYMVCPWAACTDCARAIIQSGIKKLVTHKQAYDKTPESWSEDIALALTMLKEANVEIVFYDGVVGVQGVRFGGQLWNP